MIKIHIKPARDRFVNIQELTRNFSIDSIIWGIFKLAGSLGIFLYGMKTMSDGVQKAAGEKLHKILNFITNNRFAAVVTGFLITAIIHSSSATTVMVVSFVNASLLNLTRQ